MNASLQATLEFVDENKLEMSENTYLEICNLMKKRYEQTPPSFSSATLREIQSKMNAFDKRHGAISIEDERRVVGRQLSAHTRVVYFATEQLRRFQKLLLQKRYVSSEQELTLLYVEERNRRCRNHPEYVRIKRLFEEHYNICPYMGLYD